MIWFGMNGSLILPAMVSINKCNVSVQPTWSRLTLKAIQVMNFVSSILHLISGLKLQLAFKKLKICYIK